MSKDKNKTPTIYDVAKAAEFLPVLYQERLTTQDT